MQSSAMISVHLRWNAYRTTFTITINPSDNHNHNNNTKLYFAGFVILLQWKLFNSQRQLGVMPNFTNSQLFAMNNSILISATQKFFFFKFNTKCFFISSAVSNLFNHLNRISHKRTHLQIRFCTCHATNQVEVRGFVKCNVWVHVRNMATVNKSQIKKLRRGQRLSQTRKR